MADMFKTNTMKEWSAGVEGGDGWNAWGADHTQKRHEGRKRIKRAARHRLKQQLRREINEL